MVQHVILVHALRAGAQGVITEFVLKHPQSWIGFLSFNFCYKWN